jgi:glycerol uptake facilitator-like aquaporin
VLGYNFQTFNVINYEFFFIASFISWDVSAAHFNMGTTLTCFFYELTIDDFNSNKVVKAVLVIISQLLGALFGIFVTYVGTQISD